MKKSTESNQRRKQASKGTKQINREPFCVVVFVCGREQVNASAFVNQNEKGSLPLNSNTLSVPSIPEPTPDHHQHHDKNKNNHKRILDLSLLMRSSILFRMKSKPFDRCRLTIQKEIRLIPVVCGNFSVCVSWFSISIFVQNVYCPSNFRSDIRQLRDETAGRRTLTENDNGIRNSSPWQAKRILWAPKDHCSNERERERERERMEEEEQGRKDNGQDDGEEYGSMQR